ncbi:MAG: hypothetical protein V1743_02945 [Nanoarchaeota archaeon]
MIITKTKKWGNSIGVLIPKEEVRNLNLKEDQEIMLDVIKKGNSLKELFGFGKGDKISRKEFLTTRKLLESKRV